jgi:plastocyanin
MRSSRALCSTTIALFALLAACGGAGVDAGVTTPGGRDTTGAVAQNAVAVRDNVYSPTVTTVLPGSTVTWTWSASNTHDVTFDDGVTSGLLTHATYQRTFTVPGTYRYHCTLHGATMSGTIVVQ